MTDQALDGLARRVMLDAARQEYGSLMDELPEHDFSPEFERKMRKLACLCTGRLAAQRGVYVGCFDH